MLSLYPSGMTISQTSANDVQHRHTCITYVDFNQTCCSGCFLLSFTYFCLHCVFVVAHSLSLVAASRAYSLLRFVGSPLRWPLQLQSELRLSGARTPAVAARRLSSWAHGLGRPAACGVFLGQGLNWHPLHLPLDHQRSPKSTLISLVVLGSLLYLGSLSLLICQMGSYLAIYLRL